MIVIPDSGLLLLVSGLDYQSSAWVHLYRTDTPLTRNTTLADLVELDTPGYLRQRAVSWSPPTIRGDQAVTEADPLRWTRGAGPPARQIYGYYVTFGSSGPLLWAERGIEAPYTWDTLGQRILVIARFSLARCLPGPTLVGGDLGLNVVSTVAPYRILGVGDLGLDGLIPPAPELHGGDIMLGSISIVSPYRILGVGDLGGDGTGETGPPLTLGVGDLGVDGVFATGPPPTVGGGDLGVDGTSETGPPPIVGGGDLGVDAVSS